MYSANVGAWLASSAWAHRWWLGAIEGFSEVLFPGRHRRRGRGRRRRGWRGGGRASQPGLAGLGRDVAGFYAAAGGARLLGRRSVPTPGCTGCSSRPCRSSRCCARRPAWGIIVTLALVVLSSAAAGPVAAGARPAAGVGRRRWRCLAALELNMAPLTALREAPPVPEAYRTLARLPRAPLAEFPYFARRTDYPAARRVHARLDLPLAAAGERLQRLHPRRTGGETAEAMSYFPTRAVVPHPQRHRRPLRRLPPERLQHRSTAPSSSSGSGATSSSCARWSSRTTCGSTKSSTGPTSAVRRAGGGAHLAARRRADHLVAARQRRHGAERVDPRLGRAPAAARSARTCSTPTSSIPSRARSPSPSTWWCRG